MPDPAVAPEPRHRMAWGIHVVVDAALGVGLLIAGVHGHGPDYLVLDVAGGYLIVLTLVTDAPGGIAKVVSRLVHRLLDGLVALGLLASPVICWHFHVSLDVFATAMAEAVGVILGRDALVSEHRRRQPALRATASPMTPPIDTTAVDNHMASAARRVGVASARVRARAEELDVAGAAARSAHRAGTITGWARRRMKTPPSGGSGG